MLQDSHKTLGYYLVGNKKFTYKNAATYEAVKTQKVVTWHYFDDVWQNFSETKLHTLGKESLKSVYKRRAQQLRDEYDYLILHYSGGSDSHEILMTFLDNNIKLDEVFVQMALEAKEKVHKPNNIDKSAANILSEWDYAIKPVLDMLKIKFPEVKITVSDYLQNYETNFQKLMTEDTYVNNYHFNTTMELFRAHFSVSDNALSLVNKDRKVAEILGIDKPLVILNKNKFSLFFHDVTMGAVHPLRQEKYGVHIEPFYWTPKMPEICFEQAHVLMKFFQSRPDLRYIIDIGMFEPLDQNYMGRLHAARKIYYETIYHYFDGNIFQVDKPVDYSNHGRSREKFFVDIPDFKPYFNKVDYYIKSFMNEFGAKSFLDTTRLKKHYFSKPYYVGDFV